MDFIKMTELNDNTPVFCTAEIPKELLDNFFTAAYSAPDFINEGITGDAGVLINEVDPRLITQPTNPPIPQPAPFPFKDKTPQEIWQFAQANIRYPIFNRAIAILDQQTLSDQETCLLVTTYEEPQQAQEAGPELLTVRSDFRSALVILNVKNLGIGGDEHFKNGKDENGVIRLYGGER